MHPCNMAELQKEGVEFSVSPCGKGKLTYGSSTLFLISLFTLFSSIKKILLSCKHYWAVPTNAVPSIK